jgi:hypothetical protein
MGIYKACTSRTLMIRLSSSLTTSRCFRPHQPRSPSTSISFSRKIIRWRRLRSRETLWRINTFSPWRTNLKRRTLWSARSSSHFRIAISGPSAQTETILQESSRIRHCSCRTHGISRMRRAGMTGEFSPPKALEEREWNKRSNWTRMMM